MSKVSLKTDADARTTQSPMAAMVLKTQGSDPIVYLVRVEDVQYWIDTYGEQWVRADLRDYTEFFATVGPPR